MFVVRDYVTAPEIPPVDAHPKRRATGPNDTPNCSWTGSFTRKDRDPIVKNEKRAGEGNRGKQQPASGAVSDAGPDTGRHHGHGEPYGK